MKKGSKARASHVKCHAFAAVRDVDPKIFPGRQLGQAVLVEEELVRGDRQAAPLRHGIARIHREVEQRILELAAVDHGDQPAVRQSGVDRHILAQDPAQQRNEVAHQLVEVHGHGPQRLQPGKGQQPLRQLAAAQHGLLRMIEKLDSRLAGRQGLAQKLEIPMGHRQQIVEVMGNAAGQLADGLDLERLAQLRLEAVASGQIGEHADEMGQPAMGIMHRRDRELIVEGDAVLAVIDHLAAEGPAVM